ncbi:MAG: hypothetical protein V3S98_01105, partial [Dehalococcoidia bacterium]
MPQGWPYGDTKVGPPSASFDSEGWNVFTGMAAVTENASRGASWFGGATVQGYHIACTEDNILGNFQGRYFSLFTPNDFPNGSDLGQGRFHSSERRLLGWRGDLVAEEAPDFAVMGNSVYATDGTGRWLAGTIPATYVRVEDNSAGTFVDEDADAASNATSDVLLLPETASVSLVDDAIYIGADAIFSGAWIDQTLATTLGSGGTQVTTTIEYFNGVSFVNFAVGGDQSHLFGDGSLSSYGVAEQHRLFWGTLANWATTTIDGQSAFWIRLRVTTGASGSGYVAPKARKVFIIESGTPATALLPASYAVGNDPGTTAPRIKGWGLHRLDVDGTSQISVADIGGGAFTPGSFNIFYTWYDSTRDIETEPVNLG